MAKEKKKNLSIEVVRQMLTLATSGFGLVAALAWNNVIQTLVNNYIKKFLPIGSDIISLLIYAIIVTVIAVTVTVELSQVIEKFENIEIEKLEILKETKDQNDKS
ncbi:MAG: DUF5654 family protein, partial [Candidatus Levyibacteriota bacterium]